MADIGQLEHTDITMIIHGAGECAGEHCVFHNRSDHHMRLWPQHFRWDRGIVERICEHGVGHPDPDQEAFFNKLNPITPDAEWTHGCCGCC